MRLSKQRQTRGTGGLSLLKLEILAEVYAAGSVRLFSVRHEFSTEWAKFKSVQMLTTPVAELALTFAPGDDPF